MRDRTPAMLVLMATGTAFSPLCTLATVGDEGVTDGEWTCAITLDDAAELGAGSRAPVVGRVLLLRRRVRKTTTLTRVGMLAVTLMVTSFFRPRVIGLIMGFPCGNIEAYPSIGIE